MKHVFTRLLAISSIIFFSQSMPSQAFEMLGLISYNMSQISPLPNTFKDTSNGIGYTFLGRMDLGPGQLESGFQFIPTSITTTINLGDVKTTGSYWILPLMYRYSFFPPFFSLGAGFDYAVMGTSNISVNGTAVTGINSGYLSHFGAQISAQAAQDLGENISLVLDVRYRAGLANAITYNSVGSRYNFWIIGLGIQKYLE